MMNIRNFTPGDYPAIVNIQNTVQPNNPVVIEDYLEDDERRDPKCRHRRWVAEVEGRIVGFGEYGQSVWRYDPQLFYIGVKVLPEHRRRGIGSALYDQISAALEPFDPITLLANGRANQPQGVRFLEKRGFKEVTRTAASHLDVAAFDFSPYVGLEESLLAQGIEIKTLEELQSDPDINRKLYDLDLAILPDLPEGKTMTMPEFDDWIEEVIHAPGVLPDGYFIALCGDRAVGTSNVLSRRAGNRLSQCLTATHPDFRSRGIATVLKVKCIAYAKARGVAIIETGNDMSNRPMLSINNRLGFVKQPDSIDFEKDCRIEPAMISTEAIQSDH